MTKNIGFIAIVIVLTGIIGLLQYQLWFGPSGVFVSQQLKVKVAQEKELVSQLSERNQRLYDEVISLRENDEVVEGLARENLGLIKEDETFYLIIPARP